MIKRILSSLGEIKLAQKLFLLTISMIFLLELLIMLFLEFIFTASPAVEALLDAVLITVLVSPILYFTIFKRLEQEFVQRELAHRRLEESRNHYQMLVNELEEGVVLETHEGIISFVNPRFLEMVGYQQEDLLGKHRKVILPQAGQISADPFNGAVRLQDRYETYLLTKGKIRIPVLVSSAPVLNHKGRSQGVLSVFMDISEQKKYQELQERFISTTSHELRTPVTVIRGYVDLLKQGDRFPAEEQDRIFGSLTRNLDRLTQLIGQVHMVTQIRRENFQIFPHYFNLEEFIETIRDQCRMAYPNRGIIVNHLNNVNYRGLILDQDKVIQAVHNLLDNAVKNSHPRSLVELTFQTMADSFQISVVDHGSGISFHNILGLFHPFTHFDTPYSVRGSGLGLYVVKSIAFAHQGHVEVHSQEQVGSRFMVYLPIQ
ncbi:MAG: sensor histidine kinase [Candidatus Thorarchaeota archaeon]